MQRESSRAVRGRRPSVPIPSRPPLRRERAKAEEPPPSVTAEEKQPQEEEEGETKASKRRRKDGEQAAQKEQQQKQQLRPRPPVGPRMSYVFFCAAKREDVAAENPYRSPTERNRILAQMWRSMHLDEREVCVVPHPPPAIALLLCPLTVFFPLAVHCASEAGPDTLPPRDDRVCPCRAALRGAAQSPPCRCTCCTRTTRAPSAGAQRHTGLGAAQRLTFSLSFSLSS